MVIYVVHPAVLKHSERVSARIVTKRNRIVLNRVIHQTETFSESDVNCDKPFADLRQK